MNVKVMKVVQIGVSVLAIALPAVTGYFDNQKMKDEVAKQVSEALAKKSK